MNIETETSDPSTITAPDPTRAPAAWKVVAARMRPFTIIFALVAVWLIFSVVTDGIFLEPRNLSNLIRQTAVTGILSVGMVMVIITGQIDLSVGSLVGLTGMAAVLAQVSAHTGLIGSLTVALTIGLIVGAFQGWLSAYIRIPSFIVTLGGLLAWRGLTKGISAGNTYPVENRAFKAIGQAYVDPTLGYCMAALAIAGIVASVLRRNAMRNRHELDRWGRVGVAARIIVPSLLTLIFVVTLNRYAGVPVPVLILVAVALAGFITTQHTRFGRYLYAIGGNAEAAKLSGVNVPLQVLTAFAILGLLAGVAGIIYTARVGSAGPDAGTLLELDAIAACVIGGASLMGGRGTVLGACLGALFMASLDNGMSLKNVSDYIQDIVKGGILVGAVGLDVVGRNRRD
jgi:D-xylose transport system permease protein